MTDHELAEDIRYIRERVDDTNKQVSDLRVSVEHRLTKMEGRASVFGLVAGAIAAFLTSILHRR